MTATVMYKGPKIHRRVITHKDLKSLELEGLPDKVDDLVWEPGSRRKSVDITDLGEGVLEYFKSNKAFQVKEDDKVTSKADPNAAVVNADGSSGDVQPDTALVNPRGVGGSTRNR